MKLPRPADDGSAAAGLVDTRRASLPHGFELRRLRGPREFDACVTLQREVWGAAFSEVVPSGVLRVVQYVGGVAAGAFAPDGRLAGFVFGVSGIRRGRLSHWSDTLAVHPDFRDRGIGEQLKRYQRRILLPLGVERVYWTFDPLESRNAYLNFARLGVVAGEYRRDFYGDASSELHSLIGTDRLVAVWRIRARRVRALLAGGPRVAARAVHSVPAINATVATADGPESGEPRLDLDAPRVRLLIPSDIQRLKRASPALADGWRRVTRAAFEAYFERGYVATDLVRAGDCSSYLLERAAAARDPGPPARDGATT